MCERAEVALVTGHRRHCSPWEQGGPGPPGRAERGLGCQRSLPGAVKRGQEWPPWALGFEVGDQRTRRLRLPAEPRGQWERPPPQPKLQSSGSHGEREQSPRVRWGARDTRPHRGLAAFGCLPSASRCTWWLGSPIPSFLQSGVSGPPSQLLPPSQVSRSSSAPPAWPWVESGTQLLLHARETQRTGLGPEPTQLHLGKGLERG